MNEDKNLKDYVNSSIYNLKGFVETYIKILKLEIKSDLVKMTSLLLLLLGLVFLLSFFFLFIGITCALALNVLIGSASYWGFLWIGLVYFLFFIFIFFFRKKIYLKANQYIDHFII